MKASSIVPVTLLGPVSGGTIAWRSRGALHLTVVVKATGALVPDGRMALVEPDRIALAEEADPSGAGLRTAGDMAPYLARPEIWLTGHAALPGGARRASLLVELALLQDRVVRIERQLGLDARGASGDRLRIAGAGPISSAWPLRRRWLEGHDARRLEGPVLDIPEGLNAEYFQTAPVDQRLDELRGDETLVLVGMVASHPKLWTQLPGVTAVARLYRRSDRPPRSGDGIRLRLDTLQVDVDRLRCSLLWRGHTVLASDAELQSVRVAAGVSGPEHTVKWTDPFETEKARFAAMDAMSGTMVFDGLLPSFEELTGKPLGGKGGAASAPPAAAALAAAAPAAPAPAAPAQPGEVPFAGTMGIPEALQDLFAQKASLPFQRGAVPDPAVAQPSPPKAHARPVNTRFSETLGLSFGQQAKLQEKSITPFAAPLRPAEPIREVGVSEKPEPLVPVAESPASEAPSPPAERARPLESKELEMEIELEPVEPGGLGAEFLGALAEAEGSG